MRRSWIRALAIPALTLLLVTSSQSVFASTYQVRSGDTLWSVAQNSGVDLQDLIYANSLKNDYIYPGLSLKIPGTQGGPDYSGLRQQLQQYAAAHPGVTYGIYLEDLISGKTMNLNADTWIPAASTIKIPAVLYLNQLAAEGKIDWQAKIAYNAATDYQDGAGVLQFFAQDGDKYSFRVLANLAITTSDNIAYKMLVRYLGKDNIAAYMRSLGARVVFPNGATTTTAHDMGIYMAAILNFYRQNPDLGRRLLDDMANPIWDVGLPGRIDDSVTVAHKEGDVTSVQNDVGIIWGSRPYILTILTKGEGDTDKGFASIAEISKIVYDYQEQMARQ